MTDEAALKLQALLKLQPGIITNDRLKRPNFPGDTKTPEQKIPTQSQLDGKDWETCMTMNGSWGYKSWDHNWKSAETLIHNLVDIASKGGNYLLNVGPEGDGTIPQESIDRLKAIGAWMKVNHEAIYATKASPVAPFDWGRCTSVKSKNNTTLYFSVFNWPADGKLVVPGLKNKIVSAKLLAGGNVKAQLINGGIQLNVPAKAIDPIATVIKVVVKGEVPNVNLNSNSGMKAGALD
jgi:alpha-L-fucosidase